MSKVNQSNGASSKGIVGAMSLTDREKEQLKTMIDAGQPLPPHFQPENADHAHQS